MAKLFFVNSFTVLFVWFLVELTPAKSMQHEEFSIGHKDIGLKEGYLACHCDTLDKSVEKSLDMKTAQKFFRDVAHDNDFQNKMKDYPETKDFVDCFNCNLTIINCTEKLCIKKVVMFPLRKNVNQTEVTEPSKISGTLHPTQLKNNESINVTATTNNNENNYNVSTMTTTSNGTETNHNEPGMPVNALNFNLTNDQHVNNSKINDEMPPHDHVLHTIDIPIGGHKNHSLQRRYLGCSYPSAMETAAIACRVYPSSIKCVQRCAFGYTLESGIRKEMQCKFKENRWVPSGFKECLPFVDCSVTLASGGSATCATASVDQAPMCNIECLHYEDKPHIPAALYKCNISGTWDPPLPFCAIPGSGMVLATPPRVKLHTDQ